MYCVVGVETDGVAHRVGDALRVGVWVWEPGRGEDRTGKEVGKDGWWFSQWIGKIGVKTQAGTKPSRGQEE